MLRQWFLREIDPQEIQTGIQTLEIYSDIPEDDFIRPNVDFSIKIAQNNSHQKDQL